jgi:hypothetical protein
MQPTDQAAKAFFSHMQGYLNLKGYGEFDWRTGHREPQAANERCPPFLQEADIHCVGQCAFLSAKKCLNNRIARDQS